MGHCSALPEVAVPSPATQPRTEQWSCPHSPAASCTNNFKISASLITSQWHPLSSAFSFLLRRSFHLTGHLRFLFSEFIFLANCSNRNRCLLTYKQLSLWFSFHFAYGGFLLKFLRNSSFNPLVTFSLIFFSKCQALLFTLKFLIYLLFNLTLCDVSLSPYLAQIIPDLGLAHFSPRSVTRCHPTWEVLFTSRGCGQLMSSHTDPLASSVTATVLDSAWHKQSTLVTLKQACLANY